MSHRESWPYALSMSIKQFIYFHFRVFDLFHSLVLFFLMVGISFWHPVCKKHIAVTNSRGLYNQPVIGSSHIVEGIMGRKGISTWTAEELGKA